MARTAAAEYARPSGRAAAAQTPSAPLVTAIGRPETTVECQPCRAGVADSDHLVNLSFVVSLGKFWLHLERGDSEARLRLSERVQRSGIRFV